MAKQIIMLAGQKRSGKDSVGMFMKRADPTIKLVSFASPMKQIIAETFNIDRNDLDEWKNEGFTIMHGIPPEDTENMAFQTQTYREILQRFGSDAMKPIFGFDVWAQVATKFIDSMFKYTDTVVITDFRFQSEHEYLYEYYVNNGTADEDMVAINTIYIDRGLSKEDMHASERDLDEWPFNFIIHNKGSLNELEEDVSKLMEVLNG